ncbi:GNAT family N-acetyltransferase [Streptomyces sp. NPDC058737]|uniref:GNAT family N-acetyltransferase n=1 Tax=Streptomyces sp. NPDC058737 TaxID=3346617 RepID=UPI0036A0CFC7
MSVAGVLAPMPHCADDRRSSGFPRCPTLHGQGLGGTLYRAFFALVRAQGRRYVHCVTSPENTVSRNFHARLGFAASGPLPDYDGPGLARVAAAVLAPLARAAVPVFTASTYHADLVLVPEESRELALDALRSAGFDIC